MNAPIITPSKKLSILLIASYAISMFFLAVVNEQWKVQDRTQQESSVKW